MTDAAHPARTCLPDAGAPARDAAASWRWPTIIIAAAALAVFAAGVTSSVVRGDEGYHTQFARAWYELGPLNRPTHNPLYASGEPPGYYYSTEPLWPLALSLVWHLTGPVQWAAQLYQAAFYALLLGAVYGMGRHLAGPRGGLAALLVAVSVPMFGAFSVLLYTDVPAAALITLTALLVLRRHMVAAGVVLGLAYLTKRHTLFLAPGLLLWTVLDEGTWRRRLARVPLMLGPALLVVLPDTLWRRAHLPALIDPASMQHVAARARMFLSHQRLPSNLNNARDLAAYLGALLPATAVLYLARRAWRHGHGLLWLTVLLFLAALGVLFTFDTDIRYTMPTVGLAVALAAAAWRGGWRRTWVLGLVGAVAFAHLGAVVWTVHAQRRLTPGQHAVFTYLREETPPDALVLYPGEVVLTQARRRVVWSNLLNPETGRSAINPFLRAYDAGQIEATLRANDVDYLCIDETRIDAADSRSTLVAGYPPTFVARLPELAFLERVPGPWPGITLYRVRPPDAGAGREPGP